MGWSEGWGSLTIFRMDEEMAATILKEQWKCPNGDMWEVHVVQYMSTKTQGGFDIVISVQHNGREVGHVTEHYDSSKTLLKKNTHPHGFDPQRAIPSDCQRIS